VVNNGSVVGRRLVVSYTARVVNANACLDGMRMSEASSSHGVMNTGTAGLVLVLVALVPTPMMALAWETRPGRHLWFVMPGGFVVVWVGVSNGVWVTFIVPSDGRAQDLGDNHHGQR
jgi:hypothetical protein